jgi:hypothetical protein
MFENYLKLTIGLGLELGLGLCYQCLKYCNFFLEYFKISNNTILEMLKSTLETI